MRMLAFGGVSAGLALAIYVAHPLASDASANLVATKCRVSGATYPELMPEYYIWEVYFRTMTDTASGKIEGVAPPLGKQFHPTIVNNNARYLGITDDELVAFLEVGTKALKKVDQIREREVRHGGADVDPQARVDAIEVILDARDDVARRVSPSAMRALRKNSPARGTVFDFPVVQ